MNPSVKNWDLNQFADYEEEDSIQELEYASVTVSWLQKSIAALSKNALLKAEKKHKAAVKIQSNFRGWKTRQKILLWRESAIKIQKTWRGYIGRKRYFFLLEATLQSRMVYHYNKSATIIQATFRGYYSRKYTHDQCKLKQLQLRATRELLECVALKTRELLKNQQLPGLYSLRNSKCLSKVEKLMASLRIKTYNEEVRKARSKDVHKLSKAFEKSIRSKERSELPFGTAGCGKDDQHRKSSLLVEGQPAYFQLVKHPRKASTEEDFIVPSDISDLSYQLYKQRQRSVDITE